MVLKKTGFFILSFLSIGVVGYALFAYLFLPLGANVHPAMKVVYNEHPVGIYSHVFGSAIALLTGPFLISPYFRNKYLSLHKVIGKIYLFIGVLVGGLSGLYTAQFAFGGLVSTVGFSMLSIIWLFSAYKAFLAIINKKIQLHQHWVYRNFALTFAAVTLRIYLGILMGMEYEFETVYPMISWLCWVPNILIVEWFIVSKK